MTEKGELFDISKNDNINPEKIYSGPNRDKIMKEFHKNLLKTEEAAKKMQLDLLAQKIANFILLKNKQYCFDFRLKQSENKYIVKHLNNLNLKDHKSSKNKIIINKYGSDLTFFDRMFNNCFYLSGRFRDDERFANKFLLRTTEIIKAMKMSSSYWKEEKTLIITYPLYFLRRYFKVRFKQKTSS